MKNVLLPVLFLGVGSLFLIPPGSGDEPKDVAKGMIERSFIQEAILTLEVEKYDLSKTGIEWHKGLDAVLGKGKPILLLQILGNYDEVFC